jgi:hypothetical protein
MSGRHGKGAIIILVFAVLFGAAACACWYVLSKTDFLGSVVYSTVSDAVSKQLNVKLDSSPLKGNPITGLSGSNVSLSRSGDKLVTVKNLDIKLSLPSLMKGSPRIGKLTVEGLSSDIESLNKLVPKTSSDKPVDIPINKVVFKDCRIATQLGVLEFGDSTLKLKGSQWFNIDAQGRIKDVATFAAKGIVRKENKIWIADGLSVKLDNGTAHINGAVYPSPDVTVDTKEINISKIAALFPEVRSYGVRGILTASVKLKGTGRNMQVKGKALLKDALIHGMPLKKLTAYVDYDKGLLKAKIDSSRIFKSMLSGTVTFDGRGKKKFLDLDAKAQNLRFADWTKEFGSELGGMKTLPHGEISSMTAKVKGPLDALVGSVKIGPSSVGYSKYELTNLQGTATFGGQPKGVVDLSALHKGRKLTLAGTVSFAKNIPTDLKFTSDGFSLEEVADAVPAFKKLNARGTVNVKAAVNGYVNKWDLRADLSSKAITMKTIGTINSLTASGAYSFKNGSFVLKGVSAVWNGARATASGRTDTMKRGTGISFKGTLTNAQTEKFWNVFEFMKVLKLKTVVNGTWQAGGTLKDPVASAVLNTPGGKMFDLKINSFSSGLRYKSGIITAEPMKMTAAGGSALARCTVDLGGAKTKWNVTGNLTSVDLTAFNGLLAISEDITGPATGTMSLYNDGSGFKWKAHIAKCHGLWRGFHVDSLSGDVAGDTHKMSLSGIKVSMFMGSAMLKGTVTLAPAGKPAADTLLDLSVTASNMHLFEILRRHMSALRGVQGLIGGKVTVRGKAGDPHFYSNGLIAPFRYRGLLLPMLDYNVEGNLHRVHVVSVSARLHSGSIKGSGFIYEKGGQWYANAKASGREVDLQQIGRYLPDKFRSGFGGIADIDLKGSGPINKFSGGGTFTAKTMKVMNIDFTDVTAPFFLDDGYAVVEDMKANSNNGKVSGGIACDIGKSYWGANLTVASADVGPILNGLKPDLKGKITGTTDLKIKIEGETGRLSTVKGGGVIFLNNGEISGFKAVEAAKKYTKGKPIRYRKAQASFRFDEGIFVLLPGSEAMAPAGDTVYRYIMLDGMMGKKGELTMMTMGKVNVRALNAMLGGLQGFVAVGSDYASKGTIETKDIVQNLLGGLISGYAKNSFRFFTMRIGGNIDKPTFNDLKIDKDSNKQIGDSAIPKSPGDPEDKDFQNGNFTIRLKFEIPVGPGWRGGDGDLGGQFLQQTFKNILSNVNF